MSNIINNINTATSIFTSGTIFAELPNSLRFVSVALGWKLIFAIKLVNHIKG